MCQTRIDAVYCPCKYKEALHRKRDNVAQGFVYCKIPDGS